MEWSVYILLCDCKIYYVGITHNIQQRLHSHRNGENIATKEYRDIQLVYKETGYTRAQAEKRENQLKGWSVAKKKALIDGDLARLIMLSKGKP